MKHLTRLSYAMLAAWSAQMSAETLVQSQNLVLARSMTNANQALEFSMLAPTYFQDHEDSWAFNAALAGVYQEYFNFVETTGLGAAPFWSGSNAINVTMSNNQSVDVDDSAWLSADQLGLGLSTNASVGKIELDPQFFQTGLNLMLQAERDRWFAQARLSVGKTVIDPQLKGAKNIANGTAYQAIFSTGNDESPYKSLEEAFAGGKNIGTTYIGLKKGLINGRQSSEWQCGDINLSAGYHLLHEDNSQISLSLRGVIPCGNKAQGTYVLEPIYGNGGYYQLGGELSGHFKVWNSAHSNDHVAIHFDLIAMHSFANSNSYRSFDLKNNGKGSKYLLVNDFNEASNQYQAQNLINLSTLKVKSSFDAEVNGLFAVGYTHQNFTFNTGIDVWVRTKETLSAIDSLAANRYYLIGQQSIHDDNLLGQPNATMGNLVQDSASTVATGSGTELLALAANSLISGNDALDIQAQAQALAATSSAFANINYQWEWNNWTPHVGVHGAWEFTHTGNNTVPQWSVGLILGSSF